MISYKFCNLVKTLTKPVKFKRNSSKESIQALGGPPVLKVLKQKLGLLSFLFADNLLEEFMKSNYLEVYQQFMKSNSSKKEQIECLNFLDDAEKEKLGAYINFLYNQHEWKVVISRELAQLADLSRPHEWYPEARKIKRKFIFHHGPTNSGKTKSAVEALEGQRFSEDTGRGIYMAPLRLLAWQIQQRLNPCNLITGQQKIVVDSKLTSCTIETANLTKDYNVAVIDEVQMIGDKERGWGWTRAILNTKSQIIHLCGQSRPLELVSKIIGFTGDTLEQKIYPRLSRLILQSKMFEFKDLRPGDCIIAFSIKKLHQIRQEIFKKSGQKSAIIYGRLPPDVRKKQAQQFNNGNLPILVSTNAIGMGLNLQIKRIIFYETQKVEVRNGPKKPLEDYMIQQIAGRAGRGLTDGHVFCMSRVCLRRVRKALRNVNQTLQIKLEEDNAEEQVVQQKEEEENEKDHFLNRNLSQYQKSISHGMLFIEFEHLQKYHYLYSYLNQAIQQKINLSSTIQSFFKDANTAEHYSIVEAPKLSSLAKKYQQLGLNAVESFNFSLIPQSKNQKQLSYLIKLLAQQFIKREPTHIPQYIINEMKQNLKLKEMENLYSLLEVYIWLFNKYQLAFVDVNKVAEMKQNICTRINDKLRGFRGKEKY